MYAQLTAGMPNKTLNKLMEVRYCFMYDTKDHPVYRYWKKINIGAIDLDNKVYIDYQELAQLEAIPLLGADLSAIDIIVKNNWFFNGLLCNSRSKGYYLYMTFDGCMLNSTITEQVSIEVIPIVGTRSYYKFLVDQKPDIPIFDF